MGKRILQRLPHTKFSNIWKNIEDILKSKVDGGQLDPKFFQAAKNIFSNKLKFVRASSASVFPLMDVQTATYECIACLEGVLQLDDQNLTTQQYEEEIMDEFQRSFELIKKEGQLTYQVGSKKSFLRSKRISKVAAHETARHKRFYVSTQTNPQPMNSFYDMQDDFVVNVSMQNTDELKKTWGMTDSDFSQDYQKWHEDLAFGKMLSEVGYVRDYVSESSVKVENKKIQEFTRFLKWAEIHFPFSWQPETKFGKSIVRYLLDLDNTETMTRTYWDESKDPQHPESWDVVTSSRKMYVEFCAALILFHCDDENHQEMARIFIECAAYIDPKWFCFERRLKLDIFTQEWISIMISLKKTFFGQFFSHYYEEQIFADRPDLKRITDEKVVAVVEENQKDLGYCVECSRDTKQNAAVACCDNCSYKIFERCYILGTWVEKIILKGWVHFRPKSIEERDLDFPFPVWDTITPKSILTQMRSAFYQLIDDNVKSVVAVLSHLSTFTELYYGHKTSARNVEQFKTMTINSWKGKLVRFFSTKTNKEKYIRASFANTLCGNIFNTATSQIAATWEMKTESWRAQGHYAFEKYLTNMRNKKIKLNTVEKPNEVKQYPLRDFNMCYGRLITVIFSDISFSALDRVQVIPEDEILILDDERMQFD